MPEFNEPVVKVVPRTYVPKDEPKEAIIEAMKEFRGQDSILTLSQKTGISRITLALWCNGATPNLGVLLEKFFMGNVVTHKLSYKLLMLTHPMIAKQLPWPYDEKSHEILP